MPNNKTVWEKSTALSTALTAALTAAAIKLDDTDSNGHEEQNSTSLELGNCCDWLYVSAVTVANYSVVTWIVNKVTGLHLKLWNCLF